MPLALTPQQPPYYEIEPGGLPQTPYKIYEATLNQDGGTGAPTATVHNNTIGAIVWTRIATGGYVGTLTGAFTTGKTTISITEDPSGIEQRTFAGTSTINTVYINKWQLFISAGAWDNFQIDGLNQQFVTIKIFNY